MRPSLHFLQQASRITFFTSPNCSLCDKAKAVVSKVNTRREFEYQEINIRATGQEQWMNKYAFDTPVIHVERAQAKPDEETPAGMKLMHRWTEEQVEALLDKVED